ncbi:MAG: immunity 8 family protein [Chitinimonas sp.]|nr:immunity 8 family protein [Chitinimonas sp.]
MKAKIKEIYSLEIPSSIEDYWPSDELNFGLSIRLIVGPDEADGGESFDLLVCTPDWIKNQYADEGGVWGHHMLIVFEYDWKFIKEKIELFAAGCSGRDWPELARKLSLVAAWEFEDYQLA